jgi:hypothetical protein
MASAIDPSVIGAGNIDKASVRLQLERARDEITALEATRVLKAGDTMTGDLTISKIDPFLILNKGASGQSNYIQGRQAGSARWGINLGGPTTSDFAVDRYSDAAAYIDTPLSIARATGAPTFANAGLWRTGLSAPPMPTSVAGIGLFESVSLTASSYTVPAGGTWAFCLQGFSAGGTLDGGTNASVAAGGTVVPFAGTVAFIRGFAWRLT